MNLQDRNLEPNMRGNDVTQLQKELRELGFTIEDPTGFLGSTTYQAVKEFQQQHNLPITGIVNHKTAHVINTEFAALSHEGYLVRGQVLEPNGTPVSSGIVVAYEKRLRSERAIDRTFLTRQSDSFEISYSQPKKFPFSIIVRVFKDRAMDEEIAVSELICDPQPIETITLIVGGEPLRGLWEYQQLHMVLRPVLKREDAKAADLTVEDADFLACKYELNPEHIALYIISHRHTRETAISAEMFYGLLRQGLPTALRALIAQPQDVLSDALIASIRQGIINPEMEQAIPRLLEPLPNQIIRLALDDSEPDQPTFAALFDVAGVNPRQRFSILERYIKRESTVTEFWDELRADPEIRNEELDELQETLKVSTIALNHIDLVRHLQQQRRRGDIGSQLRDLSRLREEDWSVLINTEVDGRKIGAPTFLGEDEEQRNERYAKVLPRMVESIFPTAVLTNRLAEIEDEQGDFQNARLFLNRHPEFEFRKTSVQSYLDEHPDALEGISEPENTVATLKNMQRLFSIAPAFDKATAITAMMRQKIVSATAIRRMGPTQFIRQNQDALGFEAAQAMYTRAARKADTALLLLSQSIAFNSINPEIIPTQPFGQNVPDLEDIFGSLDFCKCKHCRSVYSPAAYLVDILHFLSNRSGDASFGTALDALLNRRPDLGEIELSCENTNTTVPYIDLVIEILETAVVNNGNLTIVSEQETDDFFPYQTKADAQTLQVAPEHINEQAYQILRNAVYPWQLPFDLWYAEIRTYLEHLGIPFYELIKNFSFSQVAEIQADYAAEFLGLTPKDRAIVTSDTDDEHFQLWGFQDTDEFNEFASSQNVGQILKRAGLAYADLAILIKVPYIRGTQNLEILFENNGCDLDNAIVSALDVDVLERLRQFVVLWNKTIWEIEELASILVAIVGNVQENQLNENVLIQLAAIGKLQTITNVTLEQILIWLNSSLLTNTWNEKTSIYESIFLDRSIQGTDVTIFALNEDRTELSDTSRTLDENLEVIHKVLGIHLEDLRLLIDAELPELTLNLSNLSRLYQVVSLAKALRLSISNYLSIRGLSNITPFEDNSATTIVNLIETVQRITESPFTIAELDYFLRHQESNSAQIAPSETDIESILATLQEALDDVDSSFSIPTTTDDRIFAAVESSLAQLLPSGEVDNILAIINGTSPLNIDSQITLVGNSLPLFDNASEIVTNWFEETSDNRTTPVEKAILILAASLPQLRQSAREELIIQALTLALGLDRNIIEPLLRRPISIFTNNESCLSIFSRTNTDGDMLLQHDQHAAYHWLYKVALLVRKTNLTADGLDFYFTNGIAAGWPDLTLLPLETFDQSPLPLLGLLDVALIFQSAPKLVGDSFRFLELLKLLDQSDLQRTDYLQTVSSLTQWGFEDLAFLTDADALDISFPDGFRNGLFILKLQPLFRIIRLLEVSASEISRWVMGTSSDELLQTAIAVKQASRQKYPNLVQWLKIAKPLRDELREEQRDALVAYLSDILGFETSRTIYSHFLIDVEMSACMSTSRIAQAISAVQLFVQRCLMNLETIKFSSKDAEEWNWMKKYRSWEAARKVFINPENWLHTQLRDDKTHLFKQLESSLLQGEVTAASVQSQYKEYLIGLDRIANLKISAVVREWEKHRDILHVFGRTRNAPRAYYYRRWVDQQYWTPWEPVELAIEGNHLIPVIWEGNLYLFWPKILEKGVEPKNLQNVDPSSLPSVKREYEVRMVWSTYHEGQWSPLQISSDHISISDASVSPDLREVSFWPQFDNSDNLYIVNDRSSQQFRFDKANGDLVVNQKDLVNHALIEVPFQSLDLQQRDSFPNTKYKYGHPQETNNSNNQLIVYSIEGDLVLGNPQTEVLLKSTPGRFKLTIPSTERLNRSRSPFFFSDPKRTFLIIPRGTYTQGFVEPGSGSTFGIEARAVALDMPDKAVYFIAHYAERALRKQTNSQSTLESSTTTVANQPINLVLASQNRQARSLGPKQWHTKSFRFENHYHPFTKLLIRQLAAHGIDGILKPDTAKEPQRSKLLRTLHRQTLFRNFFIDEYRPNIEVVDNLQDVTLGSGTLLVPPFEKFDFSYGGAYSTYNWELFYHVPFTLARHLSRNQRFAEAQHWFHYIFDPTYIPHNSTQEPWPESIWQIKPFFDHSTGQLTQNMMLLMKTGTLNKQEQASRKQLLDQIEMWRKDPYNPYVLGRIRLEAHMKAVVMAYLDNLIAWGDSLLRNDTRESIDQATHLYILAAELLGERPQEIEHQQDNWPMIRGEEVRTFNDLKPHLDDFSNALIMMEEYITPVQTPDSGSVGSDFLMGMDFASVPGDNEDTNSFADTIITTLPTDPPEDNPVVVDIPLADPIPTPLVSLFFCIPKNDKLLGYWDVIEDRLFKIRHCMNIDGIIRQLPLYEPPIDPELLIRAKATGTDINEALSGLTTPLPRYRFQVMAAKATELANEVRSLGNALLSALEKKDAEDLALLRSGHEIRILELTERLLKKRLEEVTAQKESLLEARKSPKHRFNHYESLLLKENEASQRSNIGKKINLRPKPSNLVLSDTLPQDLVIKGEIPGTEINTVISNIKDLATGLIDKVRGVISRNNPIKRLTSKSKFLRKAKNLGRKVVGKVKNGLNFVKDKVLSNIDTPLIDTLFEENKLTVPESIELDSSLRLLNQERGEIKALSNAQQSVQISGSHQMAAALWQQIPTREIAAQPFGVGAALSFTGSFYGARMSAMATDHQNQASQYSYHANLETKVGQYIFRENDWTLQSNLAALEMMQIDKQLVTANIQIAIAEKEISNHQKRIKNAREVDSFMRDKFTNHELYSWMVQEISDVYLQTYQLAVNFAKSVERTFQYELGIEEASFIKATSWDNLKQGLLAGDKLYHDLKRMEVAYLEEHRREFELTKHISLAALNPLALLQLREIGRCEIEIPEEIFDLDYPGHYFRRIKSVSLTIPAVTGPYTTLSCTLRLLRSSIRRQSTLQEEVYARNVESEDTRFSDSFGAIQSIATSSGQNDSGLFELSFRDDRYLPFEGAGAISRWQLEMPNEFRQFDYNTITDVIIHMNYTAREGGSNLKTFATEHVSDIIMAAAEGTSLSRMFSVKQEFPSEWHQFLQPGQVDLSNRLAIDLSKNRFPFSFQKHTIIIKQIELYLKQKEGQGDSLLQVQLTTPDGTIIADGQTFSSTSTVGLPQAVIELSPNHEVTEQSEWVMTAQAGALDTIDDIIFICQYGVVTT